MNKYILVLSLFSINTMATEFEYSEFLSLYNDMIYSKDLTEYKGWHSKRNIFEGEQHFKNKEKYDSSMNYRLYMQRHGQIVKAYEIRTIKNGYSVAVDVESYRGTETEIIYNVISEGGKYLIDKEILTDGSHYPNKKNIVSSVLYGKSARNCMVALKVKSTTDKKTQHWGCFK